MITKKRNSTGLGSGRYFGNGGRRFLGGGGSARRRRGPRRAAVPHGQPLARRQRVIIGRRVVCVIKLLEPLQKLKVILKTTLHQPVNGNYLQKKKSGRVKKRNDTSTVRTRGRRRVRHTRGVMVVSN